MKKNLAIPTLTGAVFLLLAAQIFAQETGTSHPEALNDVITSTPSSSHYVKPSAAIPMASAAPATQAESEVALPATSPVLHQRDIAVEAAASAPAVAASSATAPGPSPVPLVAEVRHAEKSPIITDDENSGVIIDVPSGPNELPISTMLKARLISPISTKSTQRGAAFQASLSEPFAKNGVVLLPAGTLISGRVTEVHGGKRIGGASAIRLQPDTLTLPDGTLYPVEAEVIDLDHFEDSHVNTEGTIIANSHPKATLTALGLTTGSAAVAGAMIGGGFGAVVGAGIGAGVGTIWWLKRDREQTLPQDVEIVFSLDRPLHLAPGTH